MRAGLLTLGRCRLVLTSGPEKASFACRELDGGGVLNEILHHFVNRLFWMVSTVLTNLNR